MNLQQHTVLVTGGGGTGVGAGVCEALYNYGAQLIINDIDPKKIERTLRRYPKAIPLPGDIGDEASVAKMFDHIAREVGVINGLVNNAGVGLSKVMHEITEEEFDHVFQIDIKAVWRVSKFFVKQLLAHDLPGNIVNVSSVHSKATQAGYAAYSSAKAGVNALTRALANDLGRYNIRCNAIAPGMVRAEQNHDLIRKWADDPVQWEESYINNQQVINAHIEPIDCGNLVAFLLSDLSKAITGQTIFIDYGKTTMLFNRDFVDLI